MRDPLFWLLPPIIGGAIGYLTNAVAIKMLFRPLKEKRVLGIRIPFTPGILPRQRQILAQSIGSMVERELLTAEILRARLASPDVKDGIRSALQNYTEKFFTLPAKNWPEKIMDYFLIGADTMYPRAAIALSRFLRKKEVRDNIEAQCRILLSRIILKMNMLQRFLISAGQYDITLDEKIPDIVDDLLDQAEAIFYSDEGKKKVIESLGEEIRLLTEKHPDLNLEEILASEESQNEENAKARFDSFLTEQILNTADVQAESLLTTINIKKLVSDRIDSLDMLRVERMILDVLAGQLWWINVFGGILGALIGFSQVILSLFLSA